MLSGSSRIERQPKLSESEASNLMDRFSELINRTSPLLVAVSGGSDSMALLHLLKDFGHEQLFAATVNHGLREAAHAEARYVNQICNNLNVPHQTLKWEHDASQSKTAQSARVARYALLTNHAKSMGARAIALGHTMDDQAETLLMRAARAKPHSGTRGMSGMSQTSTHNDVRLLRPILNCRRAELRDYLRNKKVEWIDDPSNEDHESERVRVRHQLQSDNSLPRTRSIAQLASLSSRSRIWLAKQAAKALDNHLSIAANHFELHHTEQIHPAILREAFSTLIWTSGGLPYRPAVSKFSDLVKAAHEGKALRKAVGRCLVEVKNGTARFSREDRTPKPQRHLSAQNAPEFQEFEAGSLPIAATLSVLNQFRPASDDPLYEALKRKIDAFIKKIHPIDNE